MILISGLIAGPCVTTPAGRQSAAVRPLPRDVKLSAADVARLAAEARTGVKVEIPPNFELKLWAPDALIVDPVALEFDEKGTVYATSTSRNNMPLDIREHPTWVPTVHTLKTVAGLREFYEKELAPERSAKNQWLPDLNQDGSNDIRDLALLKERLYRIEDTDGDGLADTSKIMIEGFNVDPTYDVAGGLLYNQGDLLIGIGARRLAVEGRQRRRHYRSPDRDQRGLQHPPGVRRPRHFWPDDGTGRSNLLGGWGHWPRRDG